MAAAPDPDEVLCSTGGKANFQRLARLLISGGTSLLREIFDKNCPPSNLPTILSHSATKKQLKAAKLTKPQWDCLYPSPGLYGKSTDFDVTLLFRLLKTICGLLPPPTGWDDLPASTDHSLPADLARVKYYRNSIYGHVNQGMEIKDDEFPLFWQEISECLVRIAGQISCAKESEWQKVIDNYLKSPLTPEDERNVQELEVWYENDVDVKKGINQLERTVREEHQDTRKELNNTTQVFCKEARDIRDQIAEVKQSMSQLSANTSQPAGARVKLQINCSTITSNEGGASGMDMTPQDSQTVTQEITTVRKRRATGIQSPQEPQAAVVRTGLVGGEYVGNGGVPSTQAVMNAVAMKFLASVDPSNPEDKNEFVDYLTRVRKVLIIDAHPGSLIITVECSTLRILEELWEDYCIGHLNEMAEKFLVTEDILKKFGLIAVRLTTTIVEEEYRACREYFMKLSATDWPCWPGNYDDYGDLPKHQDLSVTVKKIPEQLQQLQQLYRKVHDAFRRWKPIRARTIEQLKRLATELDELHKGHNQRTATGAVISTLGGFMTVAGLLSAPFTFGSGTVLSGIGISLAGAGLGGAGGAVMAGSKIHEIIREKSGFEEVQAAVEEDRKACTELQQTLGYLKISLSHLAERLRNDPMLLRELDGTELEFLRQRIFFEDTIARVTVEKDAVSKKQFLDAATTVKVSYAAAGSVLGVAAFLGSQTMHAAGSLLGALVLPLNIGLLAKSSSELQSGSTSAIVEEIRRILNELKCPDEEEIQGWVKSFMEETFIEAYDRDSRAIATV